MYRIDKRERILRKLQEKNAVVLSKHAKTSTAVCCSSKYSFHMESIS